MFYGAQKAFKAMSKLFVFILLCLSVSPLKAQLFNGTMTLGDYTRENVTVQLQPTPQQDNYTLTLFGVKFARMMPVKLDVELAPIAIKDNQLEGDSIVPISKAKRYEKRLVRHLKGSQRDGTLSFTCQMGGKKLDAARAAEGI